MAGTNWLKRIIGKGKPLYRIERRIEETGELFNDGEHIIYVNGADRDSSTALGRLMHDFFCTDPDDMNYQQLAKNARFFKEYEEGRAAMCTTTKAYSTLWMPSVPSPIRISPDHW